MGFWIFMELMLLLTPFVMIFFGKKFENNPPNKINWAYGYRTRMSMKNKDTWIFAHKKIGSIWFKVGILVALCSSAYMLLFIDKDIQTIGKIGGFIMSIQLIFLIIPVVVVEIALKKTFDKDGNRRY